MARKNIVALSATLLIVFSLAWYYNQNGEWRVVFIGVAFTTVFLRLLYLYVKEIQKD